MEFNDMIGPLIKAEGGFQNDPIDHGNWTGGRQGKGVNVGTKYGISAARYPELNIKELRLSDAKRIYKRDFYRAPRIDRLPEHLRLVVFDHGVNAGPRRAIRMLQVLAKAKPDGVIGPETIAKSESVTLEEYSEARRRYYKRLVKYWPKHVKYLAGWLKRVDQIEAKAKAALPKPTCDNCPHK